MKNFKFKSIWLLSENEQRARTETFSPKKTLLVGMNHSGKSSLIKSLFIALGARPAGDLDRWNMDTTTLVEFSFDDRVYYVVQQHNHRALFSADGKLEFAFANMTDWGQNLAALLGFNLVLTDKDLNSAAADARAFFLPYYINQDGSWLSDWMTFKNIQQYRKPVESVLEYFTGVKPPEYYEIKSEKLVLQKDLSDVRAEKKIITNIKNRFGKTIPLNGPKIAPEIFNQDIDRLTQEVNELNVEQEKLRHVLVRERETAETLATQTRLAEHALAQYSKDASYLQKEPHDVLTCPVCHAEHDKTFLDILNYSEDARVLRNLVIQLKSDSRAADAAMRSTRSEIRALEQNYVRISAVLEVRRGDLKFGDVVKGMGAETAFAAFDAELTEIQSKIDALVSKIDKLDEALGELTSIKRSTSILKIFRAAYATALAALNMPVVETKNMRLTSRPRISGSGGPRSILAYYSALWTTTLSEYGSFSVPVVIDSPQQQGQDATNLPIMMRYIASDLPDGMQVILASESPTDFFFDKVIEMRKPYGLLKSEDYDHVNTVVRPYLDAMYSALVG